MVPHAVLKRNAKAPYTREGSVPALGANLERGHNWFDLSWFAKGQYSCVDMEVKWLEIRMFRPFLIALLAMCMVHAAPMTNVHAAEWSKNLACTFSSGTTSGYAAGAYKSEQAQPLSFDVLNISLEQQKADLRAAGKTAPGKLRVVRAINANHFIEVVNEGFMNLTTIYDIDPATGKHPAVHSRHFGLLGQPVFAQYNGTCE